MTKQMDPKPNAPEGGEQEEGEIKFCKICGEELTETNHSKEKKGLCLDCEGRSDGDLDDHTQQNANQNGVSGKETL